MTANAERPAELINVLRTLKEGDYAVPHCSEYCQKHPEGCHGNTLVEFAKYGDIDALEKEMKTWMYPEVPKGEVPTDPASGGVNGVRNMFANLAGETEMYMG